MYAAVDLHAEQDCPALSNRKVSSELFGPRRFAEGDFQEAGEPIKTRIDRLTIADGAPASGRPFAPPRSAGQHPLF
jgi:hypothetical protein